MRPDLGLKRDQKKDYLEKMLQLESFLTTLKEEAATEKSDRNSPTGEDDTPDGMASTPRERDMLEGWFW